MRTISGIILWSLMAISGNAQTKQSDVQQKTIPSSDTTPKVTGIGGIFFKSKDPKATKEWYGKNLGLAIGPYGSSFEFRNANRPEDINYLQWSTFNEKTKYFDPSKKNS